MRPCLVVFGHIHTGYGEEVVAYDSFQIAYEGLMMGTNGTTSLFTMAILVLWYQMSRFWVVTPRSNLGLTRLVNAAIARSNNNENLRAAKTVVI